jgi:hypothetical protein
MDERHNGNTTKFRALTFEERARSITTAISNLQDEIHLHVEHSPHRLETMEECLAQVDRLQIRLRKTYEQERNVSGGSERTSSDLDVMHPIHLRSPRLADPALVTDFIMEVTEEAPDAGLRR